MAYDLPPPASVGPIADLSYRNYDGPLHTRAIRWWIVALMSMRLLWKKPYFWLVAAICLLPYLGHGLQFYLRAAMTQQTGDFGQFPGMEELQHHKYARLLFSAFCGNVNSLILLIIALMIGAGSIAADNRANALLVYLSKPVTKGDYLLGKWMSIYLTVLFVAFVPALLLYLFCLGCFSSQGFFHEEPWLIVQMLAVIQIPAILHASLLVGISAWSKSSRMVGAIYAGLNFITYIVASIIGLFFAADSWQRAVVQHASISGLIDGLTQNIYHVTLPAIQFREGGGFTWAQPPPLWPLLTAAIVLSVAGIAAARMKIKAVEVVRG